MHVLFTKQVMLGLQERSLNFSFVHALLKQ